MKKITVKLPVWAAAYMLYGDATGLSDEEELQIRTWVEKQTKVVRAMYGEGQVVFAVDHKYDAEFENSPAFGLPCACYRACFEII